MWKVGKEPRKIIYLTKYVKRVKNIYHTLISIKESTPIILTKNTDTSKYWPGHPLYNRIDNISDMQFLILL